MHSIEFSDEELRLLHGHKEADVLRSVKALLAKLPPPA